ncbi:BPI-like_protein [Hexamita inflata]|uniref:BPI-like protein n=1 Tax=Hexamita inflata TaxID=28002 RepID=A0AA86NG93_9EUKA|nr:BPI-like protein [Hexamita inflata]
MQLACSVSTCINVLVNGSEVKLKLTAKLQIENDVQSEKCQVFFIYEKYEADSEDPMINLDQIQDEVVIYPNSVSKFATYQLGYTHLTDLNQYSHMMDPVEHVIRLVGQQDFICPK